MKKKTHKLSVDIHSEFHVWGISSHENDYRLSWAINTNLNLNLSKSSNLEIVNTKTQEIQEFNVFMYNDEDSQCRYDLVSNRCHDGFLLPEYKNVDYFLIINGEIAEYELKIMFSRLKQIEIITLAFPISDLTSKSLGKLHF